MEKPQKQIPAVATKKEIESWYGINRHRLNVWLKNFPELGRPIGHGYSKRQLILLFSEFGCPDCFVDSFEKLAANKGLI